MQAFNYQSEQSLEFKPQKQHKNKQTKNKHINIFLARTFFLEKKNEIL